MPTLFGYDVVMTAGVLSSIIAGGITIIQYTLPLFLGVILGGVIQNASNANTWSVITTLLHGSRLHTVSFSDSVSTRNVARPVLYLYYLGLFSLGLTALSGVLTPLGIYEVLAVRNIDGVPFRLVTDCPSLGSGTECLIFDSGTQKQIPYRPMRACGPDLRCPGHEERTVGSLLLERRNAARNGDSTASSKDKIDSSISTYSGTAEWAGYRTHLARSLELPNRTDTLISPVPAPLTSRFGNTSYYGASVTSVFDIRYRSYIEVQSTDYNEHGDTGYHIGDVNLLSSLILGQGYKLIDGLIVDISRTGVGFRNHSIPDGEEFRGMPWDEVLLWIEPQTVCVANNVSIEKTTGADDQSVFKLVDQGGFGQLAGREEPQMVADVAGLLDLGGRAWKGAYFFNKEVGTAVGGWVQGEENGSFLIQGSGVLVEELLHVCKSMDGYWKVDRMALGARIVDGKQNTTGIDTHCAGFVPNTTPGAPLVTCGLVIGAGNFTWWGSSRRWVYPLFTCATAIRASLKTVSFMSNSTLSDNTTSHSDSHQFPSLWITGVSTMRTPPPTWGIELTPGFNASEISLLWGPLGPDKKNTENLRTLEAEYLYLPAGNGGDDIVDSIAGTGAYQYAAGMMYRRNASMPEYTGGASYALYKDWMRLVSDEKLVAMIPNQLWMDLFANLVTTWSQDGNRTGTVHVHERVVRYDKRYSVPVVVLLALWVGAGVVSFAFWQGDRVRVREMRQLLNQVSTGRLLVNVLEVSNEAAVPTKSWASGKGETVLGLRCRGTAAAEAADVGEGYQTVGGMVVGFVEDPVKGRLMEVLKGREVKTM
ncbi:hypothetical protein DFP73DRAFT_634573 [Morchella snyderi]|nr:hypothetical protein DFP73DRAFT_634573 [Morchella snyderi]